MSGTAKLAKTGAGTLTLTGTHSYTGGTSVFGGTLAGHTGTLQGKHPQQLGRPLQPVFERHLRGLDERAWACWRRPAPGR